MIDINVDFTQAWGIILGIGDKIYFNGYSLRMWAFYWVVFVVGMSFVRVVIVYLLKLVYADGMYFGDQVDYSSREYYETISNGKYEGD